MKNMAHVMAGFLVAALAACGGGGSSDDTAGIAAPTVASTSPAKASTGVALSAPISVEFSQPMDGTTVNASSLLVSAGGAAVAGEVRSGGSKATFTPARLLAPDTTYTVTVTTDARAATGRPLGAAHVFSFTTGGLLQMGGARQGATLNLSGLVSTLAGAPLPGADGIGTAARFDRPGSVASDGTHLFVADTYNHTIRKIVLATGAVSTIAGAWGAPGGYADGTGPAARFDHPAAIATDGVHLFVADSYNYVIRKIVIATGEVTTLAGTAGTSGAVDATGTAARFSAVNGLATDGTDLYVADTGNHTIRRIVIATAVVSTLAGASGSAGFADGIGTAARFSAPQGIVHAVGQLFVADTDNRTVRSIVLATAAVSTLAGTAGVLGSADGTGTAARFGTLSGIASDGTHVYVADTSNHTIRSIVIASGVVTTLAGTAGSRGSTDGVGAAARFYHPSGLATTDGIHLHVADVDNSAIRTVTVASAQVTTLAGVPVPSGSLDAVGTAARFDAPRFATTDGTNVYVTDAANHTVRTISIATGAVSTLAGSPGAAGSADGRGAAARFDQPAGITTDGVSVYVADYRSHTIRKISPATGEVSTLAGTAGLQGDADGIGPAATLNNPYGLTTDGVHLFVSTQHTIRKIVLATGAVSTLAGTAGMPGATNGIGADARFNGPAGLTVAGNHLYVVDADNALVRKVDVTSAEVSTVAGSPGVFGSVDGVGAAAGFAGAIGITSDGTQLFVTEGQAIRKLVLATGAVTTLAGDVARLGAARGITTDGRDLFVVDTASNGIVRVR